MMNKVYIIQEYLNDVSCDKTFKVQGTNKLQRCGYPIRCSRIIHEITTNKDYAIQQTKDKPDWSYEEFKVS